MRDMEIRINPPRSEELSPTEHPSKKEFSSIEENSSMVTKIKKRSAAELLFLAMGVLGILSFFRAMNGISFSEWIVYPSAAALCWLAWYLSNSGKKIFILCVLGLAAVFGAAVFLIQDILRIQIAHIIECIADGSAAAAMQVTETAVLTAAALAFIIALSEFLLKSHRILSLLTMAMLLLSPLFGIRAGMFTMLLLFLFQMVFGAWQEILSMDDREEFEGVGKQKLSVKSGLAAACILIGIFLAVFPWDWMYSEEFYRSVYEADGLLRRTILKASGRAGEPVAGGQIRNGNNYPTGTAHLELEASLKPREMLYLCGFEGDEYIGGNWTGSNDEALLSAIMEKQGWNDWANMAGTLFDAMYYQLNANMLTEYPAQPISLTIKHYGGAYDNLYVPYYSQRSPRYYQDEKDGYWYDYGYGNTREGYVFLYYEQQDMKIQWDNVWPDFALERDWYRELQGAYMKEIQTAYTKVPTNLLPRLTRLCQEHPLENLEEITTFILCTLHSSAVYTLTPGWAPWNEDAAEYFLFEGGRGYCEHFASAAALMYRLYGIPARYATGYLVSPEDFEQQENGGWKTIVTDESAHAWVEIFLPEYGWTPVEATPSTEGRSAAAYPGFDSHVLEEVMKEQNWSQENMKTSRQSGDSLSPDNQEELLSAFERNMKRYGKELYAIAWCVLYSLCLLPFLLNYRRWKRLKKLEKAGCRNIFSRLLHMLQYGGILKGYDGTEPDFARAAGEALSIPVKDTARLQEIVSRAAYGGEAPTPEEEEYVRKTYTCFGKAVYKRLAWHRKLLFRYWKAFY